MIFESAKFIKSVYKIEEIPKLRLPEIILCGRSNVGKSSFINSFLGRKNLAKVSGAPGKTKSINYYVIDDKFYLVDLPGFGYAKVSKEERKRWAALITNFLAASEFIKLAIHFIDCRHKPTELDITLNCLLNDLKLPHIILLSKTDKIVQAKLHAAKKNLQSIFSDVDYEHSVVLYSAVNRRGRHEISELFKEMFY
jgi:GTP-binding protein